MRKALITCALFCGALASGEMNRFATVDLGFGLPHLMGIDASVRVFKRWYVGVGYGILPVASEAGIGYIPAFDLKPFDKKVATGATVTFYPKVSPKVDSFTPFIRFFPKDDNFYIQVTMGILRGVTRVTGGIEDSSGNRVDGANISGIINSYQLLPTVSIGNFFRTEFYFLNVSLGATILATVYTRTSLAGQIPDSLGGTAANQLQIDSVNTDIENGANQALQELRSRFPIFPSVQLSFGFLI